MDIQKGNEQFLRIDTVKKIFSEHDIHWDENSQKWQFDFSVPDVEVNYFLGAWKAWQAAKASVAEGFVLVEKTKIKTWYQDDSEPENFCYEADDFDVLGECLDHEDIIQVNKIEDAIIQTTPLFGVWKFKIIGGQVERDRFVLCSSEVEAGALRNEYRRMIGLEAQEPSND